jgi:protein-L-isoaspartate O-methyltransferase
MGDDGAEERRALLAAVRERGAARDAAVARALLTVPRHVFLPGIALEEVYRDDAIVTKRDGDGVPISSSSQPTIMAIMLDQLGVAPGHRVLEIGAGTGYNAALLAQLVGPTGEVVSIDIDEDVVERARAGLAAAGAGIRTGRRTTGSSRRSACGICRRPGWTSWRPAAGSWCRWTCTAPRSRSRSSGATAVG